MNRQMQQYIIQTLKIVQFSDKLISVLFFIFYFIFILNKMNLFVSIVTPTYNRRKFIPILKKCILEQNYDLDKIEWLIYDDGTDKIADLVCDLKFVTYYYSDNKKLISDKRNFLNDKVNGDYIVCMDDDDYYPPDRISYAIESLKKSNCLIGGASKLYIYRSDLNIITQDGPYKGNHSCNGSLAYKREYLKNHKYISNKKFGEEPSFLNERTEELIQFDSMKTILCIAHDNNTVKKHNYFDTKLQLTNFINNKTIIQFYNNLRYTITIVSEPCILNLCNHLSNSLQKNGFKVNIVLSSTIIKHINKYKNNKNHIFFITSIFRINYNLDGCKYIIYQLEQNVSGELSVHLQNLTPNILQKLFNNSLVSFDYCNENIKVIQNKLNYKINLLPVPIKYNNDIVSNKYYDILFVGAINHRRTQILDKLKTKYKIMIIHNSKYNNELHSVMNNCKILLNIHYYENAFLERPRINEGLEQNMLIVSEKPFDTDIDICNKYSKIVNFIDIIDTNHSELINTIDLILDNYNEYRDNKIKKYKQFIEKMENEFDNYINNYFLENNYLE
jgi:glycosyltransferase involved in cell wall biosynthesis